MPLYDYRCLICMHECEILVRNVTSSIPECCNKSMIQLVARPGKDIFPKEGLTLEHVESNPVHFDSYVEMKKYAKKRNLELGAIL